MESTVEINYGTIIFTILNVSLLVLLTITVILLIKSSISKRHKAKEIDEKLDKVIHLLEKAKSEWFRLCEA